MPLCGIAGFCLNPNETVNARRLAASLLYGIETRGYDATGAAWRKDDGTVEAQKQAVPARKFIKDTLSVPRGAQDVILHTRFATQGSENNNLNNHPVRVGPVVGVHNGMISNDRQLFNRMGVADKRQGEVDTEAIFAAIFYGPQYPDGTAIRHLPGCDGPWDALAEVRGSAAVAWLDERDEPGRMHLGRTRQSPLYWAQTDYRSLVFASTMDAVAESCEVVGMKIVGDGYLDEGTYCLIEKGSAKDVKEFKPMNDFYYGGSGGYVSLGRSAWDWDDNYEYAGDENKTSYGKGYSVIVTRTEPQTSDSEMVKRLDLQETIDCTPEKHYLDNPKREENIDRWMNALKANDQDALSLSFTLKAFSRVGEWVSTTLAGEDVYGQIMELPESFPAGWYVLRLIVPSPDCSDYEAVIVRREAADFETIKKNELAPLLTMTSGGGPVEDGNDDDETPSEYVATGTREFELVNAACLSGEGNVPESEGGDCD